MIDYIISIFFTLLIIVLICTFFISLYSFIKRRLTNSTIQNNQSVEIERKLDKIIELLEKDKNNS
ncbi:DUF4083 family protein [Pseudogracilibacillus sp. SE30717A]|uniref:DUF4083 family protein n=1 Tax=Pseudogracilibacillus sp. SE30717A TaxID=3098293 RepID=UPI00300E4622